MTDNDDLLARLEEWFRDREHGYELDQVSTVALMEDGYVALRAATSHADHLLRVIEAVANDEVFARNPHWVQATLRELVDNTRAEQAGDDHSSTVKDVNRP